jgi:hypothetical protein
LEEHVTSIFRFQEQAKQATSMRRHLPDKHVPMATDTYGTIEEMLEAVFYIWSVLRLYNECQQKLLRKVSSFTIARVMRQKSIIL